MVWTPKKARGDFCPEPDLSSPKSRLHSVVNCAKPAETGDFQGSMVWWRDTAGLGGGAGSLERTRLWGLADLRLLGIFTRYKRARARGAGFWGNDGGVN